MQANSETLELFHPLIAEWFRARVGEPTDVQVRAWPAIAEGRHVLITAPTGSGKTLAAFLWAIDRLVSGDWATGRTRVLYVSPLKALNNDIQRNLLTPLVQLRVHFAEAGAQFPSIGVQTRSGDTAQSERRRMLSRPPEILITTPESLNILLSSRKARGILADVETVILDEIHAVLDTKRGTHLITAVDRLVALAGEFQRVALSATVKPLETVADFVAGFERVQGPAGPEYRRRPVTVIRSDAVKPIDLRVESARPREATVPVWHEVAGRCLKIIQRNRSTLVFTNSRRLCERICMLINEEAGRRIAYAHHGSLSREARTEIEHRFKAGELAAIVATNSLELGIDIGALDEVVLVGTPGSVASAIQRIGRAGHGVGETSRGLLLPIEGLDYVYAAVMAKAVRERDVEAMTPIAAPLDVLAQVIVAATAVETWTVDALYYFVRTSWPYRELRRNQFDLVLEMLAGRYADGRLRFLDPLVSVDRIDGTVRAREGALPRLHVSGGTIPDRGYFNLRLVDSRARIGELDEEFVWERSRGDTFTLGAQSWQIRQITHNDVLVSPAPERSSFVPFWRAEQADQARHVADRVGEFLESANDRLSDSSFRRELERDFAMAPEAVEELIRFLGRQRAATEADLPHRRHVLVERCADTTGEPGAQQYLIHTVWGGRINRPYGIALAQAWEEAFGEHAEVLSSDSAILVAAHTECGAEEVLGLVTPGNLEGLLRRRLEQTGFFGARFRENAARALLLPRQSFRRRTPLWIHRLRSKRLFDAVLDRPDFPILVETWRTCLQDEFDMEGLRERLDELRNGVVRVTERHTAAASPFAGKLIWEQTNRLMYADDVPNTVRASGLSGDLIREVMASDERRPRISGEVADTFQRKAQRTLPGYAPSTPEDLLDWVKERLLIPAGEWEVLTETADDMELDPVAHKIVRLPDGAVVALEELPRLVAALGLSGDIAFEDLCGRSVEMPLPPADTEEAYPFAEWLAEWLRFYGPVTREFLVEALPADAAEIDDALVSLGEDDAVIVGSLLADSDAVELCDAENFEILLRLARTARRPSLEPLPLEALPLFIARQQGLTERRVTPEGLQDVIESLFGYPLPAERLETDILPARAGSYAPAMLDGLLQESGLAWFGCGERRVCFGPSDSLELFLEPGAAGEAVERLFPDRRGRYGLSDLLEHTRLASAELSRQLWELVWQGAVGNDSFAALRRAVEHRFKAAELPAPRSRRMAFQRWKSTRPFAGHWYALDTPQAPEDPLEADDLNRDRVRVLLQRYGVLFREILQQELPPLRWPALFRTLRLMELSGEVVSGLFFEGVPGLQFASPGAVRAIQQPLPGDAVYWLCADDPASLCGVDLQGLKSSLPKRLVTTHLVYHGARVVVVSRRLGKELDIGAPTDDPRLAEYLSVFRSMLTRLVRPLGSVSIERINGGPATESAYVEALKGLFDVVLDAKRVTLYRKG